MDGKTGTGTLQHFSVYLTLSNYLQLKSMRKVKLGLLYAEGKKNTLFFIVFNLSIFRAFVIMKSTAILIFSMRSFGFKHSHDKASGLTKKLGEPSCFFPSTVQ